MRMGKYLVMADANGILVLLGVVIMAEWIFLEILTLCALFFKLSVSIYFLLASHAHIVWYSTMSVVDVVLRRFFNSLLHQVSTWSSAFGLNYNVRNEIRSIFGCSFSVSMPKPARSFRKFLVKENLTSTQNYNVSVEFTWAKLKNKGSIETECIVYICPFPGQY